MKRWQRTPGWRSDCLSPVSTMLPLSPSRHFRPRFAAHLCRIRADQSATSTTKSRRRLSLAINNFSSSFWQPTDVFLINDGLHLRRPDWAIRLQFKRRFDFKTFLFRRAAQIKSNQIKKRSERRKHCAPAAVPQRRTESAMAVVRQSQNFPHGRPPSRGRRTAKI